MIFGVTIELRGKVSTFGPIDRSRRSDLLKAIQSTKGIMGRCTVTSEVLGKEQLVTIMIPRATRKGLDELDRTLRGYGDMPTFFSSPANPIIICA